MPLSEKILQIIPAENLWNKYGYDENVSYNKIACLALVEIVESEGIYRTIRSIDLEDICNEYCDFDGAIWSKVRPGLQNKDKNILYGTVAWPVKED